MESVDKPKDFAPANQPVETRLPSNSLLRRIGYCLLVLALFDVVDTFIPPNFMDPAWEFQMVGSLVERVPVPLLGMGLVFYGGADFRSKWEELLLKFLSWAALLTGVMFILLAPLVLVDTLRLSNQLDYQVNAQVSQKLSQLEQLEKQVSKGTDQDIINVVSRLNQGRPLNVKNPQELRSQLSSQIAKTKQTLRPQAEATSASRRLDLLKNAAKWLVGSLVSGTVFIYTWRVTRWARRGSKRGR